METGRERHRERERKKLDGGQNFSQPPAHALLHSVPPVPLGQMQSSRPPRSPAVPAPCPTLPGRGVPSSPESSHSSVRVEHPCVWGSGVGLGLRPWPGLSLQWVTQLGQEAEKQVPREFPLLSAPQLPPLSALGQACPREIPASLVTPAGLGGLQELRRREPLGGFQCRAETGQRVHWEEGPA